MGGVRRATCDEPVLPSAFTLDDLSRETDGNSDYGTCSSGDSGNSDAAAVAGQ